VAWLAAFGFPAAGLGLLEAVAGFVGVVDEVVVEVDVCAHPASTNTSHAVPARLSFVFALRFIPIY